MAVIGLSLFTFRIKHTDKTQKVRMGKNTQPRVEYLNLNNKIGESEDIFEVFSNYIIAYDHSKDNVKSTVLNLNETIITDEKIQDKNFRHMMILSEYGESGYTANIVNDTTGEVKYNKSVDEATMTKINVSILVDKDCDGQSPIKKGFIFFQSLGNISIKTQFINNMQKFLSDFYTTDDHKYKLELNQVVPKEFAKEMLRDNIINQVELISYKLPEDEADSLEDDFEYGTQKLVFGNIRKFNGLVQKISDFLDGRRRITDIIEFTDFEYNDVKVELKVGKRKRTLHLGKIDNTKIKINLPEEIKDIEGHANVDKLQQEINELYLLYSQNVNLHM